jgi:phosphatidylethanolamine-binding protein (PEBP) family uncharacterized protein
LVSGCGESGKTPVASAPASTAPTTTQAPPASTSPTSSTPSPSSSASEQHSAPTGHHGKSEAAKARAREAFQSLANAKPAPKQTAAQRANSLVSDVRLASPAVPGGKLSSESTCNGADRSPALRWSNIPPGTSEIAVVAISATPVAGKLFFDWAVAGLSPNLHEIPAGQLPQGAIVGRNSYGSNGYKICPPAGAHETYVIDLYALPASLHLTTGFDPATLRTQALGSARHVGLLIASYP